MSKIYGMSKSKLEWTMVFPFFSNMCLDMCLLSFRISVINIEIHGDNLSIFHTVLWRFFSGKWNAAYFTRRPSASGRTRKSNFFSSRNFFLIQNDQTLKHITRDLPYYISPISSLVVLLHKNSSPCRALLPDRNPPYIFSMATREIKNYTYRLSILHILHSIQILNV